ncbi:MAG: TerB N-terminal domain-containing protein, partial [Candidatus Adiutrix sp.]|nr:TerB N-terminal domain-containing protein [Candidatus Adiutrix sp.]
MAEIEKVIEMLRSDPKLAGRVPLAGRIYRDEPIILTASQLERRAPSKYLAMRKIARDGAFNRKSEARIFYEQGRFMEDFEDDFEYQGDFVKYFPTYQSLGDRQLRGYFSWRSQVRRGQVRETSLTFVFIYIYELLNQIGVGSPEEGFLALKEFWLAYREIEPQINRYLRVWLPDYVVYYKLDQARLAGLVDQDFDRALLTLLDHKSRRPGEVFAALNALSAYNMEKSGFFKSRPGAVRGIVAEVFDLYAEHCRKNRKLSLIEKFFGRPESRSYSMFASAVFYPRGAPKDLVYEINPVYQYSCQNGYWRRRRYPGARGKNRAVGVWLKSIDFLMRQRYNFKSALKAGRISKILETIIHQAIDRHQAGEKERARAEIEIDLSRLQGIRAAALATRDRLMVEEEDEAGAPEISG